VLLIQFIEGLALSWGCRFRTERRMLKAGLRNARNIREEADFGIDVPKTYFIKLP
jgi:hypothetical protein